MSRETNKQRADGAPVATSGFSSVSHPVSGATAQVWRRKDWIIASCLVLVLLLAYYPALHGAAVWDDNNHLTRPDLRSWAGLGRIWFDLGATQQYYPLTHGFFWLEQWVWDDWYLGYHVVNVLLHGLSAVLLARVLRRLEIPGAWLAAALWALHPVQVESVAWMSELKNTLSGVCYFGAALAYLRFDRERSRGWYFVSLGLFVAGLLAKSAIDTLPAALLVVFYWKRGRLSWRSDVRPMVPHFAAGIGMGLFTAWVEGTMIGAAGGTFDFSPLERCLIAGRAVWFYLGKLLWPADLTFSYPRWEISETVWWQYLFVVLALGLLGVLAWGIKRWGRGPLAAALYFCGTLFPALGFVNIYPFRYSFVADHFQYLACAGPMVLVSAGLVRLNAGVGKRAPLALTCFCAVLLSFLVVLTWLQSGTYSGPERLWHATIDKNPESWMAFNNLGNLLYSQGHVDEAIADYNEALRINSALPEAHSDLASALLHQGQIDQAVAQLQAALKINPKSAEAHLNMGVALSMEGRFDQGVAEYRTALRIEPNYVNARVDLGFALFQQGRIEDAAAEYWAALSLDPRSALAHYHLGNALLADGKGGEAIAQVEQALELEPGNAAFEDSLAWALATAPQTWLRDGTRALQLATQTAQAGGSDNPARLRTLAAAYAAAGQFPTASQTAQQALKLAQAQGDASLATALTREIRLYEAGRPFEAAH